MENYQNELKKIKDLLKDSPRGLTVKEIAEGIQINRNAVAKYLDVLRISGRVEMKHAGPAKVYFISNRAPVSVLVNYSSDLIITLDRTLKIIQINDRFLDLVKTENILGRNFHDLGIAELVSGASMARVKKAMQGEESDCEITVALPEGFKYFKANYIPTTLSDGAHGAAIILYDLTNDEKFKQELKENEGRYRALFDQNPDLIFVVDNDLNILEANGTMLRQSGIGLEELKKKKVIDFFNEKNKEIIIEKHRLIIEGEDSADVILDQEINGVRRVYSASAASISFNSNRKKVLVIVRDITSRYLAFEKIMVARNILEAISFAAVDLMKQKSRDDGLDNVLEKLGKAVGAGRAYVFRLEEKEGKVLVSQMYEWVEVGVEPMISNQELQNFDLDANGFSRWKNLIYNNTIIKGPISGFPETERNLLGAQGIRSLLAMPITCCDKPWGFIGFDDCRTEREWSEDEANAIKSAAKLIGTAIETKGCQTQGQI